MRWIAICLLCTGCHVNHSIQLAVTTLAFSVTCKYDSSAGGKADVCHDVEDRKGRGAGSVEAGAAESASEFATR